MCSSYGDIDMQFNHVREKFISDHEHQSLNIIPCHKVKMHFLVGHMILLLGSIERLYRCMSKSEMHNSVLRS